MAQPPSQSGPVVRSTGMRLPRLIREEDKGLGDVVSRLAHVAGIPACGGCQQRAAMLNRWLPFRKD